MYMNSKLAKSVRLALMFGAASGVMTSTAANAQEAEEAKNEKVERISVTGSRIQRTDIETASTVSITSAEEIKLSGYTRIEDMLNSLPQIEAASTSFLSNGATGTASIDLRGLGANRTLVLVNGRRMQPGGITTNSPDINQIPAALVKRVEVMTGGGSSTYGADAVAGVVNFIMNDEFEGLEITAGASGYMHDNDNGYIQDLMDARGFDYPDGKGTDIDGTSFNVDVSFGGSFAGGKGHAVGYATWRKTNPLRQEARDYSSCALNAAGTACGGSGNAIVPNFYFGGVADGAFDWGNYEYLTLTPDSNFQPSSGNVYNYAPINHFMRPDTRWTLGGFFNYEINDHFQPFMDLMFMNDRTKAQIAESGTFFAETYILPVSQLNAAQQAYVADNLGLGVDDEFATYIGKRNVEGGPRANLLEHSSFRIVTGTKGELTDMWEYEVSYMYAQTSSNSAYINDFFGPKIATAVDEGACANDPSCIFYDVFEYQGVTPESANNLTGTAAMVGKTSTTVVSGFVVGELPWTLPTADAPINAVFGAEWRKEFYERVADTVYAEGQLLGQGGNTVSISGDYNVRELYTELSVPVLADTFLAENVVLDLGYRWSDYSTSGSESTYKVALDWNLTESYKLRASWNRAVRAPNVTELFAPQSPGLWGGSDPCAGATPTFSAAQCANTGVTAGQYGNIVASPANQYNGLFGGNPDLNPEEADTYTFGLVAQPFENTNFTVDYWKIDIDKVIGSVDAELTVEQCGLTGNAAFCSNVNRAPGSGSLWLGTTGYVQATNINLASRHWEGVDVNVQNTYDLWGGTFTSSLIGTYAIDKEVTPLPGQPEAVYDCAGNIDNGCFASPDWRHTAKVTYSSDSFWTAGVYWRYFSSVDYSEGRDTLVGDGIGSQSYIDVKATFDVMENVGLLIGANNLFDREPPMVGGTLSTNANTVSGFYDTLGRYVHASVTVTF